jgi:2',3'-cyclic-nucleotide 2'-phosphodiesterase (5'-nucleotidase family)
MNALGIDASAIGNHEWDLGSAVYGDAIKAAGSGAAAWVGAQFPLLSANLDFSGDAALRSLVVAGGQEASAIKAKIAPSAIVTQGGEKIGIVAATTQVLERISSPTGTEVNGFPKAGEPGDNNVEVDNMALLASQLQPVIDALIAQGSNKIILTSHLQNLDNEKALAPLLKGVDIILSAGSHTALGDSTDTAFPGPTFAGGYPFVTADKDGNTTVIVSTDGEYSYLGRLVVDFDANGHVVVGSIDKTISGAYSSTDATLNQVYGADIGQAFADGSIGDKVKDISGAVQSVIAAKDGAVYGYSNVYLEGDRTFGRFQETNLGDFTADANTAAARIAVGEETFIVSLKNGGGIRASIGAVVPETGEKIPNTANPDVSKPAGAISQLDVENALRFDNKLMVFDTTAQGLLNILNFGAGLAPGNGGFPQLGGVEFSYDPDLPVGSRVQDVALVREDGSKLALVDDGVILATAPAKISVVTLNFTANNGDGYPAKANGENFRYLLNDGTLSAAIDEAKDFTAPANVPAGVLGEQKAFIDYLKAHFATPATAFDIADTGAALDERIQNLNLRGDTVLDGTGTPGGEDPGTPPAEPNDPGIPAILATAVDGVLRGVAPDNIDKLVADYESGALKLDGFVSELVKQAGDSSVPALIFANFMEGVTPTSARLDSLSVFADQQVTAYAAKGAGLPVLGAYEALGLGFSETTGFRTKYEGDTENAFILEAYQDVFGRAATTAQVAHFQAQIDYFENLYVGSKQSEAAAELHAKGAVLGQMIGVAVLNENKFKAAAEAFLIDAADGEVAYGRPLGAQSAFMTDMFV